MDLKRPDTPPQRRYPTYEEYRQQRRQFIKMIHGVAAGAVAGCVRTEGRLDPPPPPPASRPAPESVKKTVLDDAAKARARELIATLGTENATAAKAAANELFAMGDGVLPLLDETVAKMNPRWPNWTPEEYCLHEGLLELQVRFQPGACMITPTMGPSKVYKPSELR
jgi:hypothetical protein